MKNHLYELLRDRMKLRNEFAPLTLGDAKILLEYIHEIDRDFYRREQVMWDALDRHRKDWQDIKEFVATKTELAELIRERIQPLHLAITGEKLSDSNFNPAHFENMG